jgi:drug/metabolite transporter (DMT)-like permease
VTSSLPEARVAESGGEGVLARHRGILLMLVTMFFFVAGDTAAKLLTRDYPVIEIVWGRFVFHLAFLLLFFLSRGRTPSLRSRRLPLQLLRPLFQVLGTTFFFFALMHMPLATASALFFAQPLLITALSVPLLGENVGPRRWIAVLVGFLGVIVIIRPVGVVQWSALLPLATAASSALYQIATRAVARTDPVETSLLFTALFGAVAASLVLPFDWHRPDTAGWALLAASGLLSGTGHFCIIHAFRHAPASTLAPFSFTQLLWATLSGFLVFGDLPDPWTLVGAAIIIASGLYVFYRERARRAPS